jgi:hypothetical protein
MYAQATKYHKNPFSRLFLLFPSKEYLRKIIRNKQKKNNGYNGNKKITIAIFQH